MGSIRLLLLLVLGLVACGAPEVIVQAQHDPTPIKTQSREPEPTPSDEGDGQPGTPPEDVNDPPPPSPATISGVTANVLPETSRKAVVLNAIRAATTSIDAGLYLVTDTTLTTALTDAKVRGVAVRVFIDNSSQTTKENAKAVSTLESAGITVVKNTTFTFHHAKYLILDGKEAMIMTCNFTDSSFSSNREVVTKVKDAGAVAALQAVFDADYSKTSATFTDDNPLVISPDNTRNKLNGLIGNAKTEIFVAVQSVDDNNFVYRLIGMKKAGVKVRVLIADPADKQGDSGDAAWLKQQGIEVRYLPNPYLHEKVILADDKVFVGSVNLTLTSITKNREIGFVGDAPFAETMKAQLETDWNAGVVF